eukprot:TRINITY_DN21918_c0_g1_i1.p1 TRINITY_DN21918_c0_g1~~TRINITY_DN21918_c0_g1_i1.p1  ORF type:complete len:341 (-),score=44.72 TRINITY_DN21918_c0_g1_i1:73-1095(-)
MNGLSNSMGQLRRRLLLLLPPKKKEAKLSRSFAKFGWMNVYAQVLIDGEQVCRTATARWAHKKPKWDFCAQIVPKEACAITIVVRTRNPLGKDVLCGAVSIPCSDDMLELTGEHFKLRKESECTGAVHISLLQRPRVQAARRKGLSQKMGQVAPFDSVVPSEKPRAVCKGGDDRSPASDKTTRPSEPGMDEERLDKLQSCVHPLSGSWRCVDSEGLDDFLKAAGGGFLERSLFLNAGRLIWKFSVGSDWINYIAHTATGIIGESVPLDGSSFVQEYCRGSLFECRASWENSEYGGVLTIRRQGSAGSYVEVCRVHGNNLSYVLSIDPECSWSCTFRRENA